MLNTFTLSCKCIEYILSFTNFLKISNQFSTYNVRMCLVQLEINKFEGCLFIGHSLLTEYEYLEFFHKKLGEIGSFKKTSRLAWYVVPWYSVPFLLWRFCNVGSGWTSFTKYERLKF